MGATTNRNGIAVLIVGAAVVTDFKLRLSAASVAVKAVKLRYTDSDVVTGAEVGGDIDDECGATVFVADGGTDFAGVGPTDGGTGVRSIPSHIEATGDADADVIRRINGSGRGSRQ